MSILNLVFEPNPLLHQKATLITEFNEEIVKLSLDMKETMIKENGVGLAAPQIGLLQRMFVVAHKNGVQTFVNPHIYKRSLRTIIEEEGCLSIPGFFGPVKRSKHVWVKYFDEYGTECDIKASGFFARVIQHENDHLDGILFTEKIAL